MASAAERLTELFGVTVAELAGARVTGQVPIRTDVVNRLIASRLAGADTPLASVRIEPRQDNVIEAEVTPSSRFAPQVRVQAMIERQPDLPASPQLVLRWRIQGASLLAKLAAPVIANLKSLPPGVRIDGDLILIDLRDALASQGHADLLEYMRALRIETRADGFVVTFELGVGEDEGRRTKDGGQSK